ncbi:MAG: hypothetical protein M1813_003131 [Trichoglossum hirsutum]|jgi:hypothetical protein|nr:MAG: hypothetical protein M1813_003131 [Trichoglossum hirsutum]
MRHLIYVNAFVIVLDIAILCIQYADLFNIQVIFKGAVYSVKLFVEFFILNQLKEIATSGVSNGTRSGKIQRLSSQEAQPARGGNTAINTPKTTGNLSGISGSTTSSRLSEGKDEELGYSFFAGRGETYQAPDSIGGGGGGGKSQVIKTTEILINTSERSTPPQPVELQRPPGARGENSGSRGSSWVGHVGLAITADVPMKPDASKKG